MVPPPRKGGRPSLGTHSKCLSSCNSDLTAGSPKAPAQVTGLPCPSPHGQNQGDGVCACMWGWGWGWAPVGAPLPPWPGEGTQRAPVTEGEAGLRALEPGPPAEVRGTACLSPNSSCFPPHPAGPEVLPRHLGKAGRGTWPWTPNTRRRRPPPPLWRRTTGRQQVPPLSRDPFSPASVGKPHQAAAARYWPSQLTPLLLGSPQRGQK